MWIVLNALGVVGGVLLVISLVAIFTHARSAGAEKRGLARLPRSAWIGTLVVSLVLVFLGLNATAFLPGPDQREIEEDIRAFDAEFDD